MNIDEAVTVIENTFTHLIYEKDIRIGNIKVLLYFPTIAVSILEESDRHSEADTIDKVQSIVQGILEREIDAHPIYINIGNPNFNIGHVINEILLYAGFEPSY